jgi:hypothetical protein
MPLDEELAQGEEEEEDVKEEGQMYKGDEDRDSDEELEEGGAADRPESKGKGVDSPDRGKRVSEQAAAPVAGDGADDEEDDQQAVAESEVQEEDEDEEALEEAIRRVVTKVLSDIAKTK